MSRYFRKMTGGNVLPPPDSDEEFEPHFAQKTKSFYDGILIDSDSESENVTSNSEAAAVEVKTKKKKKKKHSKSTEAAVGNLFEGLNDSDPEDASNNTDTSVEPNQNKINKNNKAKNQASTSSSRKESVSDQEVESKTSKKKKDTKKLLKVPKDSDMDEIDKCVMEVNALLGPATNYDAAAPGGSQNDPKEPGEHFLQINRKHLYYENEINRLLGPDPDEPNKRVHLGNKYRQHMKVNIVPLKDTPKFNKASALLMTVNRRQNGYTYYTFDHTPKYRRIHSSFMSRLRLLRTGRVDLQFYINEAFGKVHVEAMLECADILLTMEEYDTAYKLIEHAITYMQHVAHPTFNLTDRKCILEYKYMENRPLHIALMKYLHLLTNRACHRTALELAKLLLNLDPSDPMGILLIIDTLALRARQHQWLIDAVEYWSKNTKKYAEYLFNIQHSYALSLFHVAVKNKQETTRADEELQSAIMKCPMVVMKLLKFAGNESAYQKFDKHKLFNTAEEEKSSKELSDLINMYTRLCSPKWREPRVMEWLVRNINIVAERYDNNDEVQTQACAFAHSRRHLYRGWAEEVVRYMYIVSPMSKMFGEKVLPTISSRFKLLTWDPMPPKDSVNRYNYQIYLHEPVLSTSALYDMFSSILPDYVLDRPAEQLVWLQQRLQAFNAGIVREMENMVIEEEDDDNFELNLGEE